MASKGTTLNASRKEETKKKQAETTVLDAGTVESRGLGTASGEQVSLEITEFLNGEGRLSPSAELRAWWTVWIFITRLPAPAWVDLHPGYLMRGMAYFSAVGITIGVFCSVAFDVASVLLGLPPIASACLSVGISFWVTLCFHEDGLADASDGIGGGWTRSQILKIMTDTRLGTYGCAVLVLHTITKIQLLGALGTSQWNWTGTNARGAGPALVVVHTLSRLTAPYLIRTRPYVDEAGPKSKFYSFMVQAKYLVTWYRVTFAIVTCFGVATLLYGPKMAITLIVAVLSFAHISGYYAEYLLGGVMGDYLGATICVAEVLILTMILAMDSAIANFQDFVETLRNNENGIVGLWDEAMRQPNEPIGVLVRFVILIAITVIWCSNMGHPSVLLMDGGVETEENGDANESPREESLSSSRQVAESVCKASGSTFQERYDAVRVYLDSLAKPVGSLGTLEDWAARLAALQQRTRPVVDPVACLIFAGDHGAAKAPEEGGEGCSLYPQAVTQSVLVGLERGIAGASVLARANNVSLRVVDVGVVGVPNSNNIVYASPNKLQRGGTRNFCTEPAMNTEEVERCIRIGRDELARCVESSGANSVVLGEVGIGNTTASSALIAHLTKAEVESVCGGGATLTRGVDRAVVDKKVTIVKKALKLHGASIKSGTDALARLGGAEIASLVGAMLEASERNVPILVDGFIVTAAALVATNISPNVCRIMFLTSQSAENGQVAAIESMQCIAATNGIPTPERPALAMNLRMGEATAALLAVPILRSAAAVLSDMGTIQDILSD